MSLIPSESYSFPDLEDGAARKRRKRDAPADPSSEQHTAPEPPEELGENSSANYGELIEPAEAEPEPAATPVPVEPVEPTVAPEPVSAPKPIKLVPPVRMARTVDPELVNEPTPGLPTPAPPAERQRPVKPIRPIRPIAPAFKTPPPVKTPVQKKPMEPDKGSMPIMPADPATGAMPVMPIMPVVPDELAEMSGNYADYADPEPEQIQMLEEDVPAYQFPEWDQDSRFARRRRRNKLIRFIFFEALAFALLLVSTKLEVAEEFSENSLRLIYKVMMFVAIIAVAIIPVLFYALPPTLPHDRR